MGSAWFDGYHCDIIRTAQVQKKIMLIFKITFLLYLLGIFSTAAFSLWWNSGRDCVRMCEIVWDKSKTENSCTFCGPAGHCGGILARGTLNVEIVRLKESQPRTLLHFTLPYVEYCVRWCWTMNKIVNLENIGRLLTVSFCSAEIQLIVLEWSVWCFWLSLLSGQVLS